MLQTLNWPPLAHYGHQLNVITMFKIMHQLIDALTDTILIYLPQSTTVYEVTQSGCYTTKHKNRSTRILTHLSIKCKDLEQSTQ